ncbi:ANTAR domain-containing protein [Kribbella voronezhensis]|uniref:ANTAR domain-containing protein n=1 Tax=Kribbella voronezhensis TaxID=2512212 RepID=A0A4R7T6G9_9ACTN|nr:GAF and ANTAR domain-containing protein [Kribbella voronezhensis]TDU86856.1 ANTAR domain-containing protein [Kribbella voronezhensis]
MTREHRLTQVFIELADTLVAEFDLVDFLGRLAEATVELIEADAAGLMLADDHGVLHVMASSDDQAELLELFELQQDEGPCPACFRSGQPVVNVDLHSWPDFAAAAAAGGYVSAHAVPLRLRGQVIGAMNLFRSSSAPLSADDTALAQALADMATIGLLHQREVEGHRELSSQLQHALDSRIVIEQAKGMLAERAGLSVSEAFSAMRSYARGNGCGLTSVAHNVLDGSLQTDALLTR